MRNERQQTAYGQPTIWMDSSIEMRRTLGMNALARRGAISVRAPSLLCPRVLDLALLLTCP